MSDNHSYPIFKHLTEKQFDTVRQIDRINSSKAKGPQKATTRVLHLYGQFTGELPEKFQPNGPYGHQYIKCKTIEEAEMLCQELRNFIRAEWPESMEWASDGWYRWMIHDLRQLTFEFSRKLPK